MIIRRATIWDAQKIVEMWALMQDEVDLHNRRADDIQKERFYVALVVKLYRKENVVLVAEDRNKIVGFIMGHSYYVEYGMSELIGMCDHLYVYPEYRGKCVMTDLVAQLLSDGKTMGMKLCEFITVYDPRLVKIWERKRFVPTQIVYSKEV